MLLQRRVREGQEDREPQVNSQDISHQTGPRIRAAPCVQGLHYRLWHKQLMLQTSPCWLQVSSSTGGHAAWMWNRAMCPEGH